MDEKSLKSLEHKLDVLINLNSLLVTKGMKVTEAAPLLNSIGLTPSEIATILGSTTNAVNVRISEAKTDKKSKNAKKKIQEDK